MNTRVSCAVATFFSWVYIMFLINHIADISLKEQSSTDAGDSFNKQRDTLTFTDSSLLLQERLSRKEEDVRVKTITGRPLKGTGGGRDRLLMQPPNHTEVSQTEPEKEGVTTLGKVAGVAAPSSYNTHTRARQEEKLHQQASSSSGQQQLLLCSCEEAERGQPQPQEGLARCSGRRVVPSPGSGNRTPR